MMLDDLQGIIEKLQKMIDPRGHGDYLSRREPRTRQGLIDPLLRKLGWDVSEPDMVQIEYEIERKWADYALMSDGKAVALIEAKALGKPLEDDATDQVHSYASRKGIPYMIVTNGDRWEMYEVFKQAPLEERRLMEFELSQQPAHEIALQVLLIWRPNLASGKPKAAMKPVIAAAPDKDADKDAPALGKMRTKPTTMTFVAFDRKREYTVKHWSECLAKLCDALFELHPERFAEVLELKCDGKKVLRASKNRADLIDEANPKTHKRVHLIPQSGIYVYKDFSREDVIWATKCLATHFEHSEPEIEEK